MHTPWGQSQTIEKVGTEGILYMKRFYIEYWTGGLNGGQWKRCPTPFDSREEALRCAETLGVRTRVVEG